MTTNNTKSAACTYPRCACDSRAACSAPQAATTEQAGWRCFHCDAYFTDRDSAALHFGTNERHQPMCSVSPAKYREMERRMEEYNAEDAEIHRQMHRQRNEHAQALLRAEEDGYAKGAKDASPAATTASASYERPADASRWTNSVDGEVAPLTATHGPVCLTNRKTVDIAGRGYNIVGYVLRREDGEVVCISAESAVRWLPKAHYWRLMHEQDGSLFAQQAPQPAATEWRPNDK